MRKPLNYLVRNIIDTRQLDREQVELIGLVGKLRHCAELRISSDLADILKISYGKFGDLLAEVKAITGQAPEVK